MPISHDQIHKKLIQAFQADFVSIIAPQLAPLIDLNALDFKPEEHFLDQRLRRTDLVTIVPARFEPNRVALNAEVEHKYRLQVQPRLFNYNQVIDRDRQLAVHSMVMFLNGGPPGVTCQVWNKKSLGLPIHSFHFHCLGLSRCPPKMLLERDEPLAWALAALTRPRSPRIRAEVRIECLRRIARAPNLTDDQRFLLFNCVQTYIELDLGMRQEYQALLSQSGNQEVQDMLITWAERVATEARDAGIDEGRQEGIQVGRQEGIQEGIQVGRQEGRQDGIREGLLRLLDKRFGRLSASVRRRIGKISSTDELMDLMERTIAAESLDDLGLATRS